MATASYLEVAAGGMVAAAAFDDDDAAVSAVSLLRGSGVREQDVSVLASDGKRASQIAGDRAWVPFWRWGGLRIRAAKMLGMFMGGGLPKDVRRRYGKALRSGKVVVIAAAGGQPSDTIAALFEQVRGDDVQQWWQTPSYMFAPPELAGPF